jgi:hypothetical protein
LRPQQVAGNPKDQPTKIQHRVPASRDSQSTASTIEFTTGTARLVDLLNHGQPAALMWPGIW